MRILFINQTYAPDVAASAQLLEDMARQFADHGHEVAVITSRSLYGKTGATLPRYEMRDGVAVHRVGVSRFGKGSVPARMFDAGMFYLAAIWKAWRVRLPGGRPQVTVTLTSPPYIGFIGALARMMQGGRRRGRLYVNYTMDLYPDVLLAAGLIKPTSLAGRLMLRLNKWCLQLADHVVVLGRCMKDRLVEQGIDPDKIDIISVWPVSDVLSLEEAAKPSSYRQGWGLENKFTVMYSGNLGLAHETQTIYDAALKLRDRDDIRFVVVGGGKRRPGLSRFVETHGLTNVVEKGYEPRERLADLLRLGDVHLISQCREFVGVVVPSKLFGIMASCRPALYIGPQEAEVARVIDESNAGLIFDIGEADQLAAAIERLANDRAEIAAMGRAAHDATVAQHTLHHRFRRLETLLENLISPSAGTAMKDKPKDEPVRVLLVNQAYAPDAAATAQHCEDLAKHLISQGHGVSVIASRSIYGQSGAKLPKRETLDGVHVHRVGLSLFGKRGMALRALDFGLFYIAALWRAIGVKVPINGKRKKPDVVVTLTTPPFIGGVGVLLHWLRGCRHIYWAMDLYPDVLIAAGVSKADGVMTRILAALNRWEMRRSDRVVALGRCMRDLIQSQGIKPDHIDVIGVWAPTAPDEQLADPAASSYRETWDLHGKFVVQYSGNFGLAHDYETFCDAMRRVKHRDDIVFLFAGGGKRVATVKAFAEEHGLTNVMFQPYQPRENLPDLLTLANVHLISQSQTFTGIVVPSKLFGIMAAGRASLFVGPSEAEVAQVLEETGAGLRFPIGGGEALANTILELADDPQRASQMGQAALDAARGPHHQHSRYTAWEKLLVSVSRRQVVKRTHAPGGLNSALG